MSSEYDDIYRRGPGWTQRVGEGRPLPPDTPARSTDDGQYRAFGATPAEDLETCDITWWLGGATPMGQEVQYRFLIRIAYVGDEQIQLMLTDAIIVIEGKHLRELRKRLSRRKVSFIQAYHAGFWPPPPAGEPIVERIEILYPGEARSPAMKA